MLKLSNIRVPVRIAIACLLPLVAFTGFAAKELLEKRETFSTMQGVAVVVEAVPMISSLISELQKERGASTGFRELQGKIIRGRDAQSAVADRQGAQQLEAATIPNTHNRRPERVFARNLEAANSRLAEIASMRTSIDALSIDGAKTVEFYTTAISSLITVVDAVSEMSEDGRIIRQASALASHIRRWEFTAQTRALGAQGFAAGQFTQQGYQQFMRVQVLSDAYAAKFRRYATTAQAEYVTKALRGPAQDEFIECGNWPTISRSTTRWPPSLARNGSRLRHAMWIPSTAPNIVSWMISWRR